MEDGLTWLRLPAAMPSLARFTAFARQGADAAGVAESSLPKVDLILEEVLVNVFRYAGSSEVRVGYATVAPGCLRLDVRDAGPEFNPLEHPAPNLDAPLDGRPIGGLGIFLVQSMVQGVRYCRCDGQNLLSFQIR